MSNDSIARDRSLHEEHVTERFLEARNEVSFDDVFKILTPLLLAFFRARGCGPKPVVIQIGDLKLDPERRLFWRGNDEIHLSPKEFDLLAFMMKNAGFTLTHLKLLRSVWGFQYGGELEYLRSYVYALRKKIEKIPVKPEYIVNEPWIGYRFRNPQDPESLSVQTEQPAGFNSPSPVMR